MTEVSSLSVPDISSILKSSLFYSNFSSPPKILENKTVVTLFKENSTRTKFSFELAAKRLGANVINFDLSSSSMSKGESFHETLKVLELMGTDYLVVRQKEDQILLPENSKIKVINAGSGKWAHPTQGLLDLFVIKKSLGRTNNLKVLIAGDIAHSRVAQTHIKLHEKLGNTVSLHCSTKTNSKENFLSDAKSCDVIILLRSQVERHSQNYQNHLGLKEQDLCLLPSNSIIMHPGPYNLGEEIDQSVLRDPRCKVFEQVKQNTFVRMGIFNFMEKKSRGYLH